MSNKQFEGIVVKTPMTTDFGTPDQVLDYGPIDVSCTDWREWIEGK